MKKATKGALAAAAAGSLLLGGAGSLAYWTSTGTVGGATINSGHLKLVPTLVGGVAGSECGAWKLVTDPTADPVTTVDFGSQKLVPGDQLTRVCNYTVNMTGDNLKASLTVTGGGLTDTLAPGLSTASSVYKVTPSGGSATSYPLVTAGQPTSTALHNGDAIELDLSVRFTDTGSATSPSDDDSYNSTTTAFTATLAALTVSATQDH